MRKEFDGLYFLLPFYTVGDGRSQQMHLESGIHHYD